MPKVLKRVLILFSLVGFFIQVNAHLCFADQCPMLKKGHVIMDCCGKKTSSKVSEISSPPCCNETGTELLKTQAVLSQKTDLSRIEFFSSLVAVSLSHNLEGLIRSRSIELPVQILPASPPASLVLRI